VGHVVSGIIIQIRILVQSEISLDNMPAFLRWLVGSVPLFMPRHLKNLASSPGVKKASPGVKVSRVAHNHSTGELDTCIEKILIRKPSLVDVDKSIAR